MPQLLTKESIFHAIAEQVLGYQFGEPKRVDEESLSVVLPILRHTVTPRIYSTFPETEDLAVKDSGRIDRMIARNEGKETIFLRSGTVFKGGTQERASLHSMVIFPGQEANVSVRCIHQTRGIHVGAQTKYGGTVPLMYEQNAYDSLFRSKDQSSTWNAARSVNTTMAAMSGGEVPPPSARPRRTGHVRSAKGHLMMGRSSLQGFAESWQDPLVGGEFSYGHEGGDDLSSGLADFSKNFDKILSKVKLLDDQVGLALITERGCETIEVFDAHKSWKALHEDAVKRLGPNMAQQDKASVFEYKPEKAVTVVQEVLGLPWEEQVIHEHRPSNGEPPFRVLGLAAKGYTGEVVELDGKAIHLMVLKLAAA